VFGKDKKKKDPTIILPSPDMKAVAGMFEDMVEVMYRERHSVMELELVVGMLQNEIIINKSHNAILGQVARLAFIPPTFLEMGMPTPEDAPLEKKSQSYHG
jgi:hypothetical protein